ncbi:MAG: hypothetical protein GF411_10505 [Candidatus Lokiarchaeota archaeon]|nr:hypothetical protein [Candidatus Lokiarchaeota archaeon]
MEKVSNQLCFTSLIIISLLAFPMMSVDWTSNLTDESTTSLYFVWGGMNPDTNRLGLYGPTHFGALDSSFLIIMSSLWFIGGIIMVSVLYLLQPEKSIHFIVFSFLLLILYLFLPHYFIESAILQNFQIQGVSVYAGPPLFSIVGGLFRFMSASNETEE